MYVCMEVGEAGQWCGAGCSAGLCGASLLNQALQGTVNANRKTFCFSGITRQEADARVNDHGNQRTYLLVD